MATPLELLFDLTFVAAFAQAGDQAAHLVAAGHIGSALAAFGFVAFAVCWALVSYSWIASAFDTDDWFFRVTTMVQMVGVIILALGLPAVFESIDHGDRLDNTVVVIGYVVMRVAMLVQCLRAAKDDPAHRRIALGMAVSIGVAQLGWVLLLILDLPIAESLPLLAVLYAIELGGPAIAQRWGGMPPWHPHHIAERYGLLVIITLGEVVLGTVAAVAALVERVGWSLEAVVVVIAGIGLVFGLWWTYFAVPAGEILQRHRERAWTWGYLHMVVFASIVAIGVGLHVAAYVVEGEATIGLLGAVLAVAIPLLTFLVAYFLVYAVLVRSFDPLHLLLFLGSLVVLALAVILAAVGVSFGICLLLVMLAPIVIVVGYESVGHRHMAKVMARVLGERQVGP